MQDDIFFAQGQSDAGYQRFWTLIPAADPNLVAFKNSIVNPTQVRWAVDGFDNDTLGGDAGDARIFTTLQQGTTNGVLNVKYSNMLSLNNAQLYGIVSQGGDRFLGGLNNYGEDVLNTNSFVSAFSKGLDYEGSFSINGSTFTSAGKPGYFGDAGFNKFFECDCETSNLVGKSSWFYYLTNSSGNTGDKILVDEFDNLSADGYWGLAIDPATSNYVLSYTLTPSALRSLALSVEGRARAALTEYRSGELGASVMAPAGEFAGYVAPSFVAVSPVPEANAAWLSLAGLATLLAAGTWRRRSSLRAKFSSFAS